MRSRLVRIGAACLFLAAAAAAWLHWHTSRLDPLIALAAERSQLDFYLVKAVVCEESWFRTRARGPDGEIGLMQITRGAAADFAMRKGISLPGESCLLEPACNLEIGCWYLRNSVDRYRDSPCPMLFALLRYNAGATRADSWLAGMLTRSPAAGIPADEHCLSAVGIRTARTYVQRIMRRHRSRFFWF